MTFKSFMTGPWWPHSWIAHGVLKVVSAFDGKPHGIDSIDKLLGTGKYAVGNGLVSESKKTDSTAEKQESKEKKARKEEEERQKEAKLKKKAITQVERIKEANRIVKELYDHGELEIGASTVLQLTLNRVEPYLEAAKNPKIPDKVADYILTLAQGGTKDQIGQMAKKLSEVFKDTEALNDYYNILGNMADNADKPDSPFHEGYKVRMKRQDPNLSNGENKLGQSTQNVHIEQLGF